MILKKMHGYAGKILKVELAEKTTEVVSLDESLINNFLGGTGFGSFFLYKAVENDVEAFSPGNPIEIAAGPLVGTAVPTACRTDITTKSPLTDLIACSSAGGGWGVSLKRSGYDMIAITGASKDPVILWINGGQIEFLDAARLWGKEYMVR